MLMLLALRMQCHAIHFQCSAVALKDLLQQRDLQPSGYNPLERSALYCAGPERSSYSRYHTGIRHPACEVPHLFGRAGTFTTCGRSRGVGGTSSRTGFIAVLAVEVSALALKKWDRRILFHRAGAVAAYCCWK
ncbi:uncharacterized protein [Physcomitrium patens]|uniref:uncharacterized protein n=1 Tax=Physcomitrium patens TaxID=3218 RepID=UPI003CCCE8AD